jgi:hypothetical protein
MPAAGRKPNEGQPVRHRHKPTHEWTEVEAVPFEGAPKLPKPDPGRSWPSATVRWWKAISRMPHCVLWDESDWIFALNTALVAAAFHGGDIKAATELRQREKVMGTTVDSRRDLRIRYIEPAADKAEDIPNIADYRREMSE